MNKQFHLTAEGVEELKKELDELTAKRGEIADRIKTAREFGDLSENAEYAAAREEQGKNEARIAEIEQILQNMEVIEKPKDGAKKVQLGSKVKLKSNGKTKEFEVVGTVEADPMNGRISDESPIGQALMGKKLGDDVEIKTPAETVTYKIDDIS
ncbi:MAG: transcription elongation factor GreA [Candidatus Saccharibacteria bacterium]|nr:transcription elongation factor GreA [Candidatus Saccharibacteria bacterium]